MSSAADGESNSDTEFPVLRTFHYLPPAIEEQKAFALQFIGSILAIALLAAIFLLKFKVPFDSSILWGVGAGVIYTLARSAWKLELKARRCAQSEITVAADALRITDAHGEIQKIAWDRFGRIDVNGGKLMLEWPEGRFTVGAREIESGMDLVNEVMQRSGRARLQAPSNFIPLEPR